MAKELVAERIIDQANDEGAGDISRYALYAAAGAAALLAAWLIAGQAFTEAPAPQTLSVRAAPMPIGDIRQIDMSQTASIAPAAGREAAADSALGSAAPAVSEGAASATEAPLPPLPVPRPARRAIAAAPAAERNAVVAEREAPVVQTGAPPADLGVLHVEAPAIYVPPAAQPAQPPVLASEPSGPVPPMPIDEVADASAPAGTAVHHQGLLGASERAAGTVWNWTTGAVGGAVNGVKQAF